MARDKCPECPKCLPGWLVQFGDLMSLLLTFFILLLSMAVMDKQKVEEYFNKIKKSRYKTAPNFLVGRGGEIRTHGLLYPKQARYQTAPRPDLSYINVNII